MGSEKISLYVALIVVAAVVWPIAFHYDSVTIVTSSQIIQKAAATNATAGVTNSNLTLGTPHLIGTEYLKTTSHYRNDSAGSLVFHAQYKGERK